jgi:hypothetical protein
MLYVFAHTSYYLLLIRVVQHLCSRNHRRYHSIARQNSGSGAELEVPMNNFDELSLEDV